MWKIYIPNQITLACYIVKEVEKVGTTKLEGDVMLINRREIFVACKENEYMFVTTGGFKFLDIKKFLRPRKSCDKWFKLLGCKEEKLMSLLLNNELQEAKSCWLSETSRIFQQPHQEDSWTT